MSQLDVNLGDRSYPIFIKENLLDQVEEWQHYCSTQILIVTNVSLVSLYAEKMLAQLSHIQEARVELLALPDGEQFKNLETVNLVFDCLLEKRFNRNATLIALGGGVVGDMTGFAAACYQRGVNFIQVPTTLLAQVDSSVGGKTGVNHKLGKNMIGAFYQPQCVVIDLNVLDTLPARELSAGLAEVIKYGLIYDSSFFDWLEQNMGLLLAGDHSALSYAIEQSCRVKAEVVSLDERESGVRAVLNLGHTFGHAIEAHMGYGNWLHGEAVGVGMLMACDLSHRLGWVESAVLVRAEKLISCAGLPVLSPAGMTSADYLKYMVVDKKVLASRLRLVLLRGLGEALVTEDFSVQALNETLAHFCEV